MRTTSQIRAEQRLAKDKTEEMDEERLITMFRAIMKVSIETIQVELERERGTSRRQMQQQLESLTSCGKFVFHATVESLVTKLLIV